MSRCSNSPHCHHDPACEDLACQGRPDPIAPTLALPHTPGPWIALQDGATRILIVAPWSASVKPETASGFGDYRGIHIATINHHCGDGGAPQEHAWANARVLAEGPALIEGLSQACDQLQGWVNWACAARHKAEHQAFIDNLRGLVARALGRAV